MTSKDHPPAEAAPPETITIVCAGPGPHHTFQWIPRGGRRPKFCPDHRRSPSIERSELAYGERKKRAVEIAASGDAARSATLVPRLAAGLRITKDPERAAALVGVSAKGAELAELAARARAEYPRLIDGDTRDTAQLAAATTHVLMLEVLERRAELPARDLALFARFTLEASQALKGDGPSFNYVSISLGVVPPPADGKLTAEQIALVRGADPPAETADDAD